MAELNAPNNANNVINVGDTAINIQVSNGPGAGSSTQVRSLVTATGSTTTTGGATLGLRGVITPTQDDHATNKEYVDNTIEAANLLITSLTTRITALEATTQGTPDQTSGVVVRAAVDMSAAIEMTASNPAGKMFNHTNANYLYEVYRFGRLVATGGIDHGQSAFFHPEVLGAITINFTQLDTWNTPTGYMIIESAGG